MTKRPSRDEQTLDLIYNAALKPSLWIEVMKQLICLTGGEVSSMSRLDIQTGQGDGIVAGVDANVLKDFFGYYHQINILHIVSETSKYKNEWKAKILLDEDWIPRQEFQRSEYYNDFLKPISAEWHLMIRLSLHGHDVSSIGIARSHEKGRFDNSEISVAARFQPHLVRAYGLSERFSSLQELNDGLVSALDRSSSAMILIDQQGRVLHANTSGEHVLAKGDVLRVSSGRLNAADPFCAPSLEAIIARAGARDWEHRSAGSVSLQTPNRNLPLTITAFPLRLEQVSVFSLSSAILVCVNDPSTAAAPPPEVAKMFALTAAESRLAYALVEGMSLRQVSVRYDVSIKTVRNQLTSIFAKMGVQRQVDLVRRFTNREALVSNEPKWG